MNHKSEALLIIEEALSELESPKGRVQSAVQKLYRAARIIQNNNVMIWCAIQLGETKYTYPIEKLIALYSKSTEVSRKSKEFEDKLNKRFDALNSLNLKQYIHYSNDEVTIKADASGGGYANIGFIEDRYTDLVKVKSGNDGTYYKHNLNRHINFVKKKAHALASEIYNELKFSGTVKSSFDILKSSVDDKLLDLNPVLAEQIMLMFKAVSSDKEEEWSHALTTSRRILEGLADELFPPCDTKLNGRSLGKTQYMNRLWAFMDKSIQSESNRELAKTHIDFLGSWMEKINRISNKGVHAEVNQLEAVKAAFHIYLSISDILEYLDPNKSKKPTANINTSSLDELESVLGVSRKIAKEIVKARVQEGQLTEKTLAKVPGVGPKTLKKAKEVYGL